MGFLDSIKRSIRLIKLDGKAATEIAKDSNSTLYGWIIIVIAGLLSALAIFIKTIPFDFQGFLIESISYIFFSALGILVFHGLAKLFGGQSNLSEYFRAQSHVATIGWLSIFTAIELPFVPVILEWLIILWSIIMGVVVLKSVHKLSTWKSIIVALALPLILIVLVLIGALAYFGVLSPDRFLPAKVV